MNSTYRSLLVLAATLGASIALAQDTKEILGLAVPNRITTFLLVEERGDTRDEDFAKETIVSAPAIAGVRYIFVRDGSPEDVATWAAQFSKSDPLVTFVSSSTVREFAPGSSRPSVVILDASGREAFRVAAGEKNLNLGQIVKEENRIASVGARADQNVTEGMPAVSGYDVVAYRDGEPARGTSEFTSFHQGVKYTFSSAANLWKFAETPEAYAPAYGGWCAWAMLDGDKVEVDPLSYKIVDGELLLFYNGFFGNTLKKWNKVGDDQGQAAKAAGEWAKLKR